MKHEDNRRLLIEWIKDAPIRSCKALVIKENDSRESVGNHFHNNKDEYFYLLSGKGVYQLNDGPWQEFGEETLFIPRGTKHVFDLEVGSILLGAATEPFDPNDEIKS